MQFTCDRQALYQAVTYVSKGVAQKSTIPALEGIRMQLRPGQLQLTGYDLEFGIQTNLPVDTHDTGEFVIHARLFSEALRRFSGNTILLEIDSRLAVTMHCEATEFHISAMSAEDFARAGNGRWTDPRTGNIAFHDPSDQLCNFPQ